MENCKECIYINNLSEKLEKLEKDVSELESKVSRIETENAISKEKIDAICASIARIEKSIEKIAEKIEQRDQKPISLLWGVLASVITALLISGLKFLN
jgi:predicted nuclease with TOPRIM domain